MHFMPLHTKLSSVRDARDTIIKSMLHEVSIFKALRRPGGQNVSGYRPK